MIIIGIDTGGTFTDFVLMRGAQLTIHKVLSTPHAPEQAILQGISELALDENDIASGIFLVHGSTVATNAILESRGAKTVYITNYGLADVLQIGRQARAELYNLQPVLKTSPLQSELCYEMGGRCSVTGEISEPLTEQELEDLQTFIQQSRPEAVAINLLFSYINDEFEKQIENVISSDVYVSRSSEVLPEYREYERGMTTWLNSYVGPLVDTYLSNLCASLDYATVSVMQSSGGTIAAKQAARAAVHMVLSGPAGGLAAAKFIGEQTGYDQLLTFDMGGTSTDVALIDGDIRLTSEGKVGDYPVAIPVIDMHTIGAGGGSIASLDAGGLLQVGPRSAGAQPGPACYGKGGQHATVTDANLVLGRLREDAFLGGHMQLDKPAAIAAVQQLADQSDLSCEEMALGIVRLANEHMAQALRVMSIQRGVDPRGLALMSFGGAGGLHVCALADALHIKSAIVPIHAGVLSALGMLAAPKTRQLSRTTRQMFDAQCADALETIFEPLIKQGMQELEAEGVNLESIDIQRSVDLRYKGQAYTLNVDWSDHAGTLSRFHQLHEQRYGHALEVDVELVNVRVGLFSYSEMPEIQAQTSAAKLSEQYVELYSIDDKVILLSRDELKVGECIQGPALITEVVSTTCIAPGWQAGKDIMGNLLLERH